MVLRRWTRHGRDRLYATWRDERLGWVDLKTGVVVSTDERQWPYGSQEVVDDWLRAHGLAGLVVTIAMDSRIPLSSQYRTS